MYYFTFIIELYTTGKYKMSMKDDEASPDLFYVRHEQV